MEKGKGKETDTEEKEKENKKTGFSLQEVGRIWAEVCIYSFLHFQLRKKFKRRPKRLRNACWRFVFVHFSAKILKFLNLYNLK
jgi:hypothetical protein